MLSQCSVTCCHSSLKVNWGLLTSISYQNGEENQDQILPRRPAGLGRAHECWQVCEGELQDHQGDARTLGTVTKPGSNPDIYRTTNRVTVTTTRICLTWSRTCSCTNQPKESDLIKCWGKTCKTGSIARLFILLLDFSSILVSDWENEINKLYFSLDLNWDDLA